jgi:hypothetical protein
MHTHLHTGTGSTYRPVFADDVNKLKAKIPGFKAKNSYSIERRLMDYVPTAFYGAVMVKSPWLAACFCRRFLAL